jgi:PAS domain S-box-containing protein
LTVPTESLARGALAPLVISSSPAAPGSRRLAVAVGAVSLAFFVALVPFAKTPLPAAHWFIPLNQSVLIVNDLVTATLLFGQLRLTRSRSMLVLASAYVFAAAMAVIHLLSFPGVFAADGLFGGSQTTAYLFISWHTGFPLAVAASALLDERKTNLTMGTAAATACALLVTAAVVALAGGLATFGEPLLPRLLNASRYTPQFNVFQFGQWVVTGAVLVLLLSRRSRSILGTWLVVVMTVWFCEIGLVSIFNAGRYDLGFYAGRVYSLLASTFVLVVLLTEQARLYRELVAAQETARSESALRESRAVLKLAMEGGRMGAWSRDLERGTAWYSPELEQLVGVPVGSLAPNSEALAGLIHPDDRAGVQREFNARAEAQDGFAIEFRLRHGDGSWRWMAARGRGAPDAGGQLTKQFGILVDITARKDAEEASAQIEARFRALADGMPQLVWMARPDGWVHWYNRRWFAYTGTTLQEMEGWGWQRVHDPATLPTVLARWRLSVETGEPFEMVFPIRGADGRFRPFLTRSSPLKSSDGRVQHWFGTCTDITAQQDAEEALRRADRRKDEFLATLAHELRNPLAPIRTCVELLRHGAPLPAGAERARTIIERQSNHLNRLIDDLLDVSRINEGKVQLRTERVSLVACMEDALQTVTDPVDGAAHRLDIDLPEDPLWARADPVRVTQAFVNLLSNAVKFTPPGGRIAVRASREGAQASFRIIDAGIGIEPAHLAGIFEMFAQVTPAMQRTQGGLGIGLALVRGFVDLHGGTVEARSSGLGQGSEFIVKLPLLAEVAAVSVSPAAARRIAGSRHRVLVIDDNVDAAESLAALLRLGGHEVREAHGGLDGLRIAAEFQPDVVLLDLGMPGMNGLEVARELRTRRAGSETYLVAVTGWGQNEDRQRTRDAGFDVHLTKPVDPDELDGLLAGRLSRARRPPGDETVRGEFRPTRG